MLLPLLALLLYIGVQDARTHRISNRSLLLFIAIGFITLDYENFDLLNHSIAFLIVLFLSVLFSIFCRLGVGDVKLLSLLAVFLLPPDVASYQIFVFSVAFSGFAYALCISKGDLRQKVKIPLAPAIFIGTTLAVFVK